MNIFSPRLYASKSLVSTPFGSRMPNWSSTTPFQQASKQAFRIASPSKQFLSEPFIPYLHRCDRYYSSGKDTSRFPVNGIKQSKQTRKTSSEGCNSFQVTKQKHIQRQRDEQLPKSRKELAQYQENIVEDPHANSLPISAFPLSHPVESKIIPSVDPSESQQTSGLLKITMNRKFMKPNPFQHLSRHRHQDILNAESLDSNEGRVEQDQTKRPRLWTPREIRDFLDLHVIGQDRLKRAISVAIYNHYKRLDVNFMSNNENDALDPFFVEKSNVLLIGPSGSGKTLIAKTVARLLDVPFSMNDATPLTQAGYVGDDVESCIHRLLENADYDVSRAESGIVFIDEIDKLAKRSDASNPSQRDVSGEGVQQALLRMLEGTMVNVTIKPGSIMGKNSVNSNPITVTVDTSNILFICSGAFVNLDRVIEERVSTKGTFGFGMDVFDKSGKATESQQQAKSSSTTRNYLHAAEPEDLIKYGLIPEFVGRLPVLACTDQLHIKDLVRVLTEPKNSLVRQYQKMFQQSGLELIFHSEALEEIAKVASLKKTGARGLRRIMETILMEPLFDYPGSDVRYVVITPETVRNSQHHALSFKDGEESKVCDAANLQELPCTIGPIVNGEDVVPHVERARNVVFSRAHSTVNTSPTITHSHPPKGFDTD